MRIRFTQFRFLGSCGLEVKYILGGGHRRKKKNKHKCNPTLCITFVIDSARVVLKFDQPVQNAVAILVRGVSRLQYILGMGHGPRAGLLMSISEVNETNNIEDMQQIIWCTCSWCACVMCYTIISQLTLRWVAKRWRIYLKDHSHTHTYEIQCPSAYVHCAIDDLWCG